MGSSAAETTRDVSFCAHAIHHDDVMIVPDARADHRFAANSLVTKDPHIRFYAGAPLKVENGQLLGTLCVIDRHPRELSEEQLDALRTLRTAVVSQLELGRALADLSAVERMLPMCAWCRDIRGESGEWQPIHEYVSKSATVTHGMCPQCAAKFG